MSDFVAITINGVRYTKGMSSYHAHNPGMYTAKLVICIQIQTQSTKLSIFEENKDRRYYITPKQDPRPYNWERIV